jgi:hypothetical protein
MTALTPTTTTTMGVTLLQIRAHRGHVATVLLHRLSDEVGVPLGAPGFGTASATAAAAATTTAAVVTKDPEEEVVGLRHDARV